MIVLTMATGEAVEAAGLNYAQTYDILHLHVSMDYPRAAALFADPAATGTIRVTREDGTSEEYRGYTRVLGIELDPMIPGDNALLVRLGRPRREE